MSKPRVYHCKVGTQPASIVIKGRPKIEKGARIQFRLAKGNTNVWTHGLIDQVNPDGFFFVAML